MKVFLVGGAVRDRCLNRPVGDRDWVVVGGTAEALLAAGYQQVGRDFPVFLHPKTGEEYALARLERNTGSGHQAFAFDVAPTVTLEQDLMRRDLTINAMAQDDQGQLIDPFGGQQDCKDQWLRHVSPAFSEDPLRCLRVARFAAQLPGFRVHPDTLHMMQNMVAEGALNSLSKPRIWQEWHKALQSEDVIAFLHVLDRMGVWSEWDAMLPKSWQDLAFDGLSPEGRFALLVGQMAAKDAMCLIDHVAPPKVFQGLARHVQHTIDMMAAWPTTWAPAQFMTLLTTLDAFRRPEQCVAWLEVAQVCPPLQPHQLSLTMLSGVWEAASGPTAQSVMAAGHQGAEIGTHLAAARLQAIADHLRSVAWPKGIDNS